MNISIILTTRSNGVISVLNLRWILNHLKFEKLILKVFKFFKSSNGCYFPRKFKKIIYAMSSEKRFRDFELNFRLVLTIGPIWKLNRNVTAKKNFLYFAFFKLRGLFSWTNLYKTNSKFLFCIHAASFM